MSYRQAELALASTLTAHSGNPLYGKTRPRPAVRDAFLEAEMSDNQFKEKEPLYDVGDSGVFC